MTRRGAILLVTTQTSPVDPELADVRQVEAAPFGLAETGSGLRSRSTYLVRWWFSPQHGSAPVRYLLELDEDIHDAPGRGRWCGP